MNLNSRLVLCIAVVALGIVLSGCLQENPQGVPPVSLPSVGDTPMEYRYDDYDLEDYMTPTPWDVPKVEPINIKMEVTDDIRDSYCKQFGQDYYLTHAGDYQDSTGHTSFYDSYLYIISRCERNLNETEYYSKEQVTNWLNATGVIQGGQQIINITNAVANATCQQFGKVSAASFSDEGVVCLKNYKESIDITYDDQKVLRWYLQQNLITKDGE